MESSKRTTSNLIRQVLPQPCQKVRRAHDGSLARKWRLRKGTTDVFCEPAVRHKQQCKTGNGPKDLEEPLSLHNLPWDVK